MSRAYRVWYLLAVLLALAPAGLRSLLWTKARPQAVDSSMAQAGEVLFKHDWKPNDTLTPEGDGLGPVFNATSCVACHNQVRPGGGGGLQHNVTTFTVRGHKPGQSREGVVHARSVSRVESLQDVHPDLPPVSAPTLEQLVVLRARNNHCLQFPPGVHISQRNTPALFGAKLIDEIPDRVILATAKSQRLRWGLGRSDDEGLPIGRALRLANGRVGKFGWKAQMASLSDFVRAACANELGLGNPSNAQPVPLYQPTAAKPRGLDLTALQCDQLTAFCASLPRPEERLPQGMSAADAAAGKKLFNAIGCADCHMPKLGNVDGIYSDLLLHRMGRDLVGGGSYGEPPVRLPDSSNEGPSPSEWRTPPLWGVADSAPYMHDGRAATVEEAIELHGGQGQKSAHRFAALPEADRQKLIGFLKTLRAPQ
jgi:CxxC motif-containing protein (DUF1111 family)